MLDKWHQSHQPARHKAARTSYKNTESTAARNRQAAAIAAALGRRPRYMTEKGRIVEEGAQS